MNDAFEILGLDPYNKLTFREQKRCYRLKIMKAHPDKAAPDALSQQNVKDLLQKLNNAKDILEHH